MHGMAFRCIVLRCVALTLRCIEFRCVPLRSIAFVISLVSPRASAPSPHLSPGVGRYGGGVSSPDDLTTKYGSGAQIAACAFLGSMHQQARRDVEAGCDRVMPWYHHHHHHPTEDPTTRPTPRSSFACVPRRVRPPRPRQKNGRQHSQRRARRQHKPAQSKHKQPSSTISTQRHKSHHTTTRSHNRTATQHNRAVTTRILVGHPESVHSQNDPEGMPRSA